MSPVPEVDAQAALTLEVSGDGVAWLVFDRPGSKVNILSAAVMARLDTLLGEIEKAVEAGAVRAVVVRSGKPGSFIAGADINEIVAITTEEEGYFASREAQRIFRRLEQLSIPTVAAVDGLCLGGATELILACGRRLASDSVATRIGLPEIRLGILPGFGGTTRLPRLIGLSQALPMILTGKPVSASRARRIGLVDEVVHASILLERAQAVALEGGPARRPKKKLAARLIDRTVPGRMLALRRARASVLEETRGHYPAPLVAIETIRTSLKLPLDLAFDVEARALGKLIATDVSKNLIHVFGLIEGAKKAGPAGVEPGPTERAAVLGAGVMGGGIAQLLAYNDIPVRLKDINAEAIGNGLQHARRIFDGAVRRGRLSPSDAKRRMDAIAPAVDYSGFGNADVVIEAIVERMDVKQTVLRDTETQVSAECVIASNTSSLSITELQSALDRPERFCGMHFFNPVHRMPLVEIVRGAQTAPETVATIVALTRRLGKTPVIVNDGPGFLVNRILSPYLNEAGFMLQEGASVESIDRALLDFGMPMGPLRLLDEVGLDVARHAAATMQDALGERMRSAPALAALEGTGLLGRKGGRGFYTYEGDRQRGVNVDIYAMLAPAVPAERSSVPAETMCSRSILAMINEAARVLEDGVAESPEDVDLAMITGTGFPPFRGGLLRYADTLGLADIAERLNEMATIVGARFKPAPLISSYATDGRGFYA